MWHNGIIINRFSPSMRRFITKRNIIILVVLVGAGLFFWNRSRNAAKPAEVRTATVTRGDVREIISISGKVVADKQATLNFLSAGKVAYVTAQPGDQVRRGQGIMGLDTGDLKAAERAAWYRYQAADANAKEVEDDLKGKASTENFAEKNQRVAAQTARDIAYDNWLVAQRAVNQSHLVAPFDGVVTAMTVSAVGDVVGPTDGVTVVAPGGLHFEGEVDESDIGRIQVGQVVDVTLDAYEGKTFAGTVSKIGFASRLSNTGATVFPLEISLPAASMGDFRVGMNGDADIVVQVARGVLKTSTDAVVDGEVVFKNDPEAKKKVHTGVEGVDDVEITQGVSEGDVLIVK